MKGKKKNILQFEKNIYFFIALFLAFPLALHFKDDL